MNVSNRWAFIARTIMPDIDNLVMPSTEPAYSKEEFARRGDRIYERDIEPQLGAEDAGKMVAIDIESGDFVIDIDERAASERLRSTRPDAQIWIRRIGSRYVRHFGPRGKSAAR